MAKLRQLLPLISQRTFSFIQAQLKVVLNQNRKVWNTHTGECLHTFQQPHIVRAVAFPHQPRPLVLAIGGFEKRLMLYELEKSSSDKGEGSLDQLGLSGLQNGSQGYAGHEIGVGAHQGAIKSVLWTKESNVLITGCEDKHIRWFDIRSRDPVAEVKLDGIIGSCELSNTLSTLSVAAGDKAYFFSGSTPGQLLHSIKQPTEIVSVALHEGQRKYVTGGNRDTWIRVWDLDAEEGAKELDVWKGHHGPTWNLSFSPDGKVCASGSEDGTVKLWKFCEGPYGLWK